ncbi:MAG TPA: DUF5666 domain-containing protein [Anaerolineae bacterium]|nr:DUF5666 domain-containing protein [Anaerolineae bacterium]
MKGISKKQKFWAVLGAGLLIVAASGSAFAMHTAEGLNARASEVRQDKRSTPQTSPLPTPTIQPTPQPTREPHDEVEFTGIVEAIASDAWVIGGRTVAVTAATEIKPGLSVGSLAKVEAIMQADATLLAQEIQPAGNDDHDHNNGNPNDNDNGNHNDDHGNGNVNPNNDHGNDNGGKVNTHGDNGNSNHNGTVNTNDNHGTDHNGHSNDQHGGHGG